MGPGGLKIKNKVTKICQIYALLVSLKHMLELICENKNLRVKQKAHYQGLENNF